MKFSDWPQSPCMHGRTTPLPRNMLDLKLDVRNILMRVQKRIVALIHHSGHITVLINCKLQAANFRETCKKQKIQSTSQKITIILLDKTHNKNILKTHHLKFPEPRKLLKISHFPITPWSFRVFLFFFHRVWNVCRQGTYMYCYDLSSGL